MRLADLLTADGLRTLVAGDGEIRGVYTTDLPDPARYLTGGDLVLTGLAWYRGAADAETFVAALASGGVAALGAGEALLGSVPGEVIAACERQGLPLFAVAEDVSFGTITEQVVHRLSAEWAGVLSRVLGRHRKLVAAVADGAGLDALFGLLAGELTVRCWLLSAAGRPIAGTEPGPDPALAAQLAHAYLTAQRLPQVVATSGRRYTVYPVGGPDPAGSGPRAASWFLACAGAEPDWPEEATESVHELIGDIAVERARLDAGSRLRRRVTARAIGALDAGGAAPDVLLDLLDLPAGGPLAVVSAHRAGAAAGDPRQVAGTRAVLAELLRAAYAGSADGHAMEDVPADPAVGVAADGTEVVALMPGGDAVAGRVTAVARELGAGLRADRLAIGVAVAGSRAGLRTALARARSAARLAARRPGRVAVVAAADVRGGDLLLAAVPGELRADFGDALLAPLRDYDARHRCDLVGTLRAFLDCSGSWTVCARRLHLHVNTLRYRIERVEHLTGHDLSTLPARVDFYLALRAGGPTTGGSDVFSR